MIVFDVTCDNDHTFEGWYRDSATFDRLLSKGEIACPVCGGTQVRKGLAAPRLGGIRKGKPQGGQGDSPAPDGPSAKDAAKLRQFVAAVGELRKHVEEHGTYVGDRFAEEARKIHYGEAEAQSIYGEATSREAEDLRDEGIEFHSIPWSVKHDA